MISPPNTILSLLFLVTLGTNYPTLDFPEADAKMEFGAHNVSLKGRRCKQDWTEGLIQLWVSPNKAPSAEKWVLPIDLGFAGWPLYFSLCMVWGTYLCRSQHTMVQSFDVSFTPCQFSLSWLKLHDILSYHLSHFLHFWSLLFTISLAPIKPIANPPEVIFPVLFFFFFTLLGV